MNREQKRELELGAKAANLSGPRLGVMILPFSLLFMVNLCVLQLAFFSVILGWPILLTPENADPQF